MPPRAKKAAAAADAPAPSPRVTRSKRKTADELMDVPKDTPVKKAKVEEEEPKSASKKAAKPASKKEAAKETPNKAASHAKETPAKTETPKRASKKAVAEETPAKATPAKATPAKATPAKATPAKATPAKATPAKKPVSKKEAPAKATPKTTPKTAPAMEKPASKPTSKKETAAKAEKPASKKEEPKSILKKSKKAAKEPTPEPEAAESDDESFIGAPSDSDGADSSDDESDAEDAAVKAAATQGEVAKLPHARDDASVAARLKKASKRKDVPRATVFLGRIPHGFYEDQMKEYFGQFGDVTRLRLARNPKTGASRHYAYIEFSSEPVAEIVADTMHNYLLMGHLLQCAVVPKDQVHPELWVGANKKFRKVPRARLEKVRNDKARTKEQQAKADAKVLARQDARRAQIKAAGIEYEFEGHC
ncbi:hypothetical protein CspeluHIS016_0903100 [Cutaneotrichosporon spelunceum]|uniref:RRM domain-containing protein n=1 Tax=Cutaneotrichosporon spelunceum TaxID=1672016 RepID=A0AAD3U0B0_9TREE|nr:hypothetical protein CspeluHIS016_0903100 [Cutaneotrichosporon spelunceum]